MPGEGNTTVEGVGTLRTGAATLYRLYLPGRAAFLEMLERIYMEAGGKLKAGRSQLERAQRDMARAQQQRSTAEQQAEAARRAAGLTQATSSLNTVHFEILIAVL